MKFNTTIYYHIYGIDDSFVQLNPALISSGFEFIKFSKQEFNDQFRCYLMFHQDFDHEAPFEVSWKLTINNQTIEYTDFEQYLMSNRLLTVNTLEKGYIILLKKKTTSYEVPETIDKDEYKDNDEYEENDDSDRQRIRQLLKILRIYSTNKFLIVSEFSESIQILDSNSGENDTPGVLRFISGIDELISGEDLFEIEPISSEVARHVMSLWMDQSKIPVLLHLALDCLSESFGTNNIRLKFILLITALESILNTKKDAVQHIFCRHLAMLLAANRDDFDRISKRAKELYKLRCIIVHGSTQKSDLKRLNNITKDLIELYSLVQAAMQKLLRLYDTETLQPNKDVLFEYLNRKGFEG